MIPVEALRRVSKIIVHAACPDGIASAMILHDALPEAEVIAVQYGPERDALEPEPGMLFCDMTPPDDKVDAFYKAGALVLDHHTKQRDITEAFEAAGLGVFADEGEEPGVSGAVLAYREVWWRMRVGRPDDSESRRVRELAELAGIRDTWQTDHPRWRDACAQAEVLMFYGLDCWLDEGQPPYLETADQDLGMTLLDKKLVAARQIAESGCLRMGKMALFNDHGRQTSDVAEAMREIDPSVEIVVGFWYAVTNGQMSLVFSMRSSPGGPDVGAIAKANGGGGHTHAAGFVVPVGEVRSPAAALAVALADTRNAHAEGAQ